MATVYRNDAWQRDYQLEEEMKKFVKQGIKRKEILDFLRHDFPQYAWRIPTLDRFRHFNINYIDENVSVDEVCDAVATELRGPGKLPFALLPSNQKVKFFKCLLRNFQEQLSKV